MAKTKLGYFNGTDSDWSARYRLVCFHHAGGSASSFSGWVGKIPKEIGVIRVQLPGRNNGGNDTIFTNVQELMPSLISQFREILDKPMVLYGHSLGALVAFELVRELRRQGLTLPRCLFISGRRAPQLPLSHPALYCLSDEKLMGYLEIMGAKMNHVLKKQKWRNHIFRILRADLKMSDLYEYSEEPPLQCPIYSFWGKDDKTVLKHELKAWSKQTIFPPRSSNLSGRHFFDEKGTEQLIYEITEQALNSHFLM